MADKESKVTLNWNGEQVAAMLREAAWEGTQRAGIVLLESMQRTVGVKGGMGNRSRPGEPPKVDTNSLLKSLVMNKMPQIRTVRVGTNNPVARHMEYGVTVRPKNGRYLTIPLTKRAAQLSRRPGGLRAQNLTLAVRKMDDGRLLMFESYKGKKRKGEISAKKNVGIWKLVRSSTVLPRPWVWRSVQKAQPNMQAVYNESIVRAVRQIVRGARA